MQVISYLIDINNGNAKPAENLIDFAVYMAYFPGFIWPIERSRSFLSTLQQKRTFFPCKPGRKRRTGDTNPVRKIALSQIYCFISCRTTYLLKPKLFSPLELGVWLIAFSFALYNDFAGYTSIARGVSGFFGILLVKNFNTPYLSFTFFRVLAKVAYVIVTLAKRLHLLSLSGIWSKLPSRTGKVLSILIAPIITMLISALWHNVSNNMLLWGGLYSAF